MWRERGGHNNPNVAYWSAKSAAKSKGEAFYDNWLKENSRNSFFAQWYLRKAVAEHSSQG